MPLNKLKNYIIWFCLGLYILTGIIGNFILCQGNDNHISIEIAGAESCCKSQSNSSNDKLANLPVLQTGALLNTTDCKECVDTFISIKTPDSYYLPMKKFLDYKSYTHSNPDYSLIYFNNYISTSIHKIEPVTLSNLDSLRTVILLI